MTGTGRHARGQVFVSCGMSRVARRHARGGARVGRVRARAVGACAQLLVLPTGVSPMHRTTASPPPA